MSADVGSSHVHKLVLSLSLSLSLSRVGTVRPDRWRGGCPASTPSTGANGLALTAVLTPPPPRRRRRWYGVLPPSPRCTARVGGERTNIEECKLARERDRVRERRCIRLTLLLEVGNRRSLDHRDLVSPYFIRAPNSSPRDRGGGSRVLTTSLSTDARICNGFSMLSGEAIYFHSICYSIFYRSIRLKNGNIKFMYLCKYPVLRY
jgi:hypothetical protein